MAKGSAAKAAIIEKIKTLYGKDYIGESNNKHYVWEEEDGGKIQIAISLTCPKNPIGTVDMSSAFGDGIDFTAEPTVAPTKFEPAEITQEEQDNLKALMERLGL